MPTISGTMMADRCIASCSSSQKLVQSENDRDIQDTTDFQEEDLMAENIDDLEWQLAHNFASLFLRLGPY